MKHASRIGVASIALAVVLFSLCTASALAKPAKLCIPERSGAKVLSDSSQGTCKAGYKFAELGKEGEGAQPGQEGICTPLGSSKAVVTPNSQDECPAHYAFVATGGELSGGGGEGKEGKQGKEGPEGKEGKQGPEGKEGPEGKDGLSAGELAELKSILPDLKFVASGVDGKPTIQFSGVNVQVLNGAGQTNSENGEGNLIIGYDNYGYDVKQTGSHNLVLGNAQEYTSYAGLLAGGENAVTAPFASVLGGQGNHASSILSVVLGGEGNLAGQQGSVVVGGVGNYASGGNSTVLGGYTNHASGELSSVSGGERNTAAGEASSVLGGNSIDLTGVAAVSP